jgi:hypothetical protein
LSRGSHHLIRSEKKFGQVCHEVPVCRSGQTGHCLSCIQCDPRLAITSPNIGISYLYFRIKLPGPQAGFFLRSEMKRPPTGATFPGFFRMRSRCATWQTCSSQVLVQQIECQGGLVTGPRQLVDDLNLPAQRAPRREPLRRQPRADAGRVSRLPSAADPQRGCRRWL